MTDVTLGLDTLVRYPQPDEGETMSRACTVCSRLDRAALDVELARPTCNIAAFCREHGLKETSVKRHRDEHVPSFLRIYGLTADLPKLGELHGELLRLYSVALDNLALAQAGTLYSVDDSGAEHRRVSHTAVSRAISEARKTVDAIAHLAADAADEDQRPRGMADGVLSERIAAQLERVVSRSLSHAEHASTSHADAAPVLDAEADAEVVPGGLSVEGGRTSPSQIPLDAVMALQPSKALSPLVESVIAADRATTATPTPEPEKSVVLITIPNPRYPGSIASSPEERATAGYPDIAITLDDLRARPDLLELLVKSDSPADVPPEHHGA